jgi:hypothetical protein
MRFSNRFGPAERNITSTVLLKETANEKIAILRVNLDDGAMETYRGDLVTPMDIFPFQGAGQQCLPRRLLPLPSGGCVVFLF